MELWNCGCCGAVVVTKRKKIQFRQGTSDVWDGPVVRSSDVRRRSDIRCLGEISGTGRTARVRDGDGENGQIRRILWMERVETRGKR